ncbi:MAG: hypothetical protein HYY48_10905 [Gammaproteobacteria bacterium]|nr:hypothetical protein [Gammaproteobacteria bacterium]
MRRFLLLASLMMVSTAAPARMYQWIDPDTQTPQLSGTPPTWYRSAEKGPRVFVIENGKVIDDTQVEVSEVTRQQLRENALIAAARDREAAREKLMEAERLKAAMRGGKEEEEIDLALPEDEEEEPPAEPEQAATAASTGPTLEEMKALVEQWEKLRTKGAREVIEGEEVKSEK